MRDDEQGAVGGRDNRVAWRDYYERPVFLEVPRPPDRPGLIRCPACDRGGVAPTALICPDCGHDFTLARRVAARGRALRFNACVVTAAAIAVTGGHAWLGSARWLGEMVWFACGGLWLCALWFWWLVWAYARASG